MLSHMIKMSPFLDCVYFDEKWLYSRETELDLANLYRDSEPKSYMIMISFTF